MRALLHAPQTPQMDSQAASRLPQRSSPTHTPNLGIHPKAVLRICDLPHPLSLILEQVRKARGVW